MAVRNLWGGVRGDAKRNVLSFVPLCRMVTLALVAVAAPSFC